MNRDNMRLWIDALRSGEYRQTYGYLNMDGGFCCLGVLCEVAGKSGASITKSAVPSPLGVHTYDSSTTHPPVAASEWLGIPHEELFGEHYEYEGSSVYESGPKALMFLNDRAGWSFSQIADALEARYLGEVALTAA